jgi:hypothetical protein
MFFHTTILKATSVEFSLIEKKFRLLYSLCRPLLNVPHPHSFVFFFVGLSRSLLTQPTRSGRKTLFSEENIILINIEVLGSAVLLNVFSEVSINKVLGLSIDLSLRNRKITKNKSHYNTKQKIVE